MSYIWKIFLCEWWSRFKEKRLLWNVSLSLFSVRRGIRVNLNFLTHDNTSHKTEKLCVTGSLANFQSNFHELAWNSGLYMKSHEDFMHWICLIFFISRQDSAWKQSEKYSLRTRTKPYLRLFCKNYGHAPRWATFEKFFSVSDDPDSKKKGCFEIFHWAYFVWDWGIRVHLNLLTHDNTSQKAEKLCVTGSLSNLQPNFHEFAWNSGLYMKSHEDFMHWICLIFFISRQDSAWNQSQKYSHDQTKPIWDCFVKIRSCAKMSYIWKIFLCDWWSRFKEKRLLWNISWSLFSVRWGIRVNLKLVDTR